MGADGISGAEGVLPESVQVYYRGVGDGIPDCSSGGMEKDACLKKKPDFRDSIERREKVRKIKSQNRMLLTNNSRKSAGIPLHRKKNGKKRFYTRNEAEEAVKAFLNYCDGK